MNIIDPLANLMGDWSAKITIGSIFLRLALTIILSAILGCERASKRHSAGLRTFLVISLASTIASMLDQFFIETYGMTFPIVSLGAVIALASISNSYDSNYTIAIIGFAILLCSLSLLPKAERFLKNRSNHFEIHLELDNKNSLPNFMATIRELGLRIDEIELNSAYLNSGLSVYSVSLTIISPELKKYKTHTEIIKAIQSLEYVYYIEEMK